MVKAERLIHITLSAMQRGPITAEGLAQECGVSKRTIYRDLISLSVLNVPISHDPGKGYRLHAETEIKLGDISISDADLILFCLNNNPLNDSPFFRTRLLYLKSLLQQEFEKKSNYKKDSIFFFDPSYIGLSDRHYEHLIKFLYAIYHKNLIHLLYDDSSNKSQPLVPIGLVLKKDTATFILYSEQDQCDLRVDADDLWAFSISNANFADKPFIDKRKYHLIPDVV